MRSHVTDRADRAHNTSLCTHSRVCMHVTRTHTHTFPYASCSPWSIVRISHALTRHALTTRQQRRRSRDDAYVSPPADKPETGTYMYMTTRTCGITSASHRLCLCVLRSERRVNRTHTSRAPSPLTTTLRVANGTFIKRSHTRTREYNYWHGNVTFKSRIKRVRI